MTSHGINKKAVIIVFTDDMLSRRKEYTYLVDKTLNLKIEDLVIVEDSLGNKPFGYTLAKVVQVEGLQPYQTAKATKWIVDKLDTEAYEKRKEKQRKAQEIRNELRVLKDQAEEIAIYQVLAKGNPKIQKLLGELGELEDLPIALPETEVNKND